MPRFTPFTKVEHTRAHGAEVVLLGDTLNEAQDHATKLAEERGLTFVHPYDDPLIIAGQGTLAIEMLEDHPEIDTLLVPVGGGGLISGCAIAAKAIKPEIEVIGVQADRYPYMMHALGKDVPALGGSTIAEGIAVKRPGMLTRELIRTHVDDICAVTEENIERAVQLFIEIEKTVVEGAGAAALAALLTDPERFPRPHGRPGGQRREHRHTHPVVDPAAWPRARRKARAPARDVQRCAG